MEYLTILIASCQINITFNGTQDPLVASRAVMKVQEDCLKERLACVDYLGRTPVGLEADNLTLARACIAKYK